MEGCAARSRRLQHHEPTSHEVGMQHWEASWRSRRPKHYERASHEVRMRENLMRIQFNAIKRRIERVTLLHFTKR